MGRAIALYTGGRVLMFTLVFGLLLVLLPDLDGLLALALALLVSSLVSLFVLREPRARLTRELADRQEAREAERTRLRERLQDDGA